jgi:hypothetical protein
LGIELGKQWDRTNVHPVVLLAMKQAAEEISVKTLTAFPPGKIHHGWVQVWPSIGNFRTDYLNRAIVARWGLTGNTPEEAVYTVMYLDSENKPPMGDQEYVVTLVPPPFKEPGFWSVTMYNFANAYTVENPINRYALGSDDKLMYNPDGTVTMYLQSASPGKEKEPNWLPTPKSGRFFLALRIYAPQQLVIDSAFNPDVYSPGPAIRVK